MTTAAHLSELAVQVRGATIELLAAVPADWLTRAPAGTSNHILWHAGHALWLQDVLGVVPITGRSELPAGWEQRFGMQCRPVAQTRDWPPRDELLRLLSEQLDRLLELFAALPPAQLAVADPPPAGRRDLVRSVIHGLHDEARHQGEMYLLAKLCRAGTI